MLQEGGAYAFRRMQAGATATGNGNSMSPLSVTSGSYSLLTSQVVGVSGDTITWEGTIDEENWVALPALNVATRAIATTATADGIYRLVVTSLVAVRARISTYSSGTIYVYGLLTAAGEPGFLAEAVTDHGELDGLADNDHPQYVLVSDTRANILASSPTVRTVALSSDTLEMFVWNGSAWYVAPLELIQQANTVDMGLQPPMVANDRAGYSATYITDKTIYNSAIGGNANTTEGSVRTSSGVLQAYLNGTWADVVTGFRFREDSSGHYELEHRPVGFDWWLEVMSGNSDGLGLNGLPLAQQYRVSMGAYPVHEQIVGREITA